MSVPAGVTTSILPVVAPDGTVAVISVPETTVKAEALPLNVTLVESVKFVPRIVTEDPTLPCD